MTVSCDTAPPGTVPSMVVVVIVIVVVIVFMFTDLEKRGIFGIGGNPQLFRGYMIAQVIQQIGQLPAYPGKDGRKIKPLPRHPSTEVHHRGKYLR